MNKDKKGEKRKMAVLTANCKRAFIVSPEQSKNFLNKEKKGESKKNKELLAKAILLIKNNEEKQ